MKSFFQKFTPWRIAIISNFICWTLILFLVQSMFKFDVNFQNSSTTNFSSQNIDLKFDAILRSSDIIDRVCYESNADSFFIHNDEKLHTDETADNPYYHGWYMISNVPFVESSNGTVFIKNYDASTDYISVDPIVAGLKCKNR